VKELARIITVFTKYEAIQVIFAFMSAKMTYKEKIIQNSENKIA